MGYEDFVLNQPNTHYDISPLSTGWTLLITTPSPNRRAVLVSNNHASVILAVRTTKIGEAAPDDTTITVAKASFHVAPQTSKLFPANVGTVFYVRSVSGTCTCSGEEYS